MTFLYPIAWFLAGLLPIVVALYLRRVRRREMTVPTLLFWQRALGEQQHRAFLGRLRQWLSLLLQLAIAILLLFALLRPEPKGAATAGESTVLLIDLRARMQALEPDGQTRFEKAVAQALLRVGAAREGASVALLGVGADAEHSGSAVQVISPFSHEPMLLRDRLLALKPLDAPGTLAPSVAQARELLASRPGAHRLIVITDGSDLGDLPPAPEEGSTITIEPIVVGSAQPNVAITRFAARPQLANPQAADLFLSLANYSDESVKGSVEISCNGALLDVKPFELEPKGRKVETFNALPRLDGADGRFEARLTLSNGHDALPLDNLGRAVMPAVKPLRVLLVSKGNWFLEKLFAADAALRFDFLTPEGFQPEMARNFDAVIFDQCGPDSFAALHGNALFIRSGPIPFVANADAAGAGSAQAIIEQPVIAEADAEHPMMRLVEWGNVTLLRAARLTPPAAEGWSFTAPLRDAEVPLILAGNKGREQRMAVFAFDITETDLPLRVAFPLLMANTLQWLAGRETGGGSDAQAGDLVAIEPEESVQRIAANAEPQPVTTTAGSFQPMQTGFYEIRGNDAGSRWLAVNAFSETESNLLFDTSAKPGAASSGAALASFGGWRPIWQWLALLALALLALEWGLYHRRVTE